MRSMTENPVIQTRIWPEICQGSRTETLIAGPHSSREVPYAYEVYCWTVTDGISEFSGEEKNVRRARRQVRKSIRLLQEVQPVKYQPMDLDTINPRTGRYPDGMLAE